MSRRLVLPEEDDVMHHARVLLQEAGVGRKLPTPVDDLVACAGLVVSGDVALDEDHTKFFEMQEEYAKALSTSSYGTLKSALSKTWGLIDLQDSVIYLDREVTEQKQAFLKLHEVGHKVLPWQRATYLFLDDERTLAPEVTTLYEREANRFAAETLFQGDRFTRQSRDLPLEIETPLWLARRYGSSAHTAIRRYVEVSHRCCSVLVMKHLETEVDSNPAIRVAYVVRSPKFAEQFEGLTWPNRLRSDSVVGNSLLTGRQHIKGDGLMLPDRDGRSTECGYHIFQNSWSSFALVFPLSETLRRSRNKIRKRSIRL